MMMVPMNILMKKRETNPTVMIKKIINHIMVRRMVRMMVSPTSIRNPGRLQKVIQNLMLTKTGESLINGSQQEKVMFSRR